MQEASTALISSERKPPLSSTCKAWMVAPPGEQTLSLSWPGCCSESSSILAAPCDKKEELMAVGHLITCSTESPATKVPADSPLTCPQDTNFGFSKEQLPQVSQNTDQEGLGPQADSQASWKPHFHTTISKSIQGCESLWGECILSHCPTLFSGTQSRGQQKQVHRGPGNCPLT